MEDQNPYIYYIGEEDFGIFGVGLYIPALNQLVAEVLLPMGPAKKQLGINPRIWRRLRFSRRLLCHYALKI